MYIDSTTEIINAVTGDLTSSDKTEQVSMEDIIQTANDFPTLQLKNINVTAVKTINGNTFTGVEDVDWQIIPPMKPITIAKPGDTNPAAGVILTSPATAPEAIPSVVGLPLLFHSINSHPNPPAAAAN